MPGPAVSGPVWAIVVAAGEGRRYGGRKQFDVLGGAPVIERALAVADEACDGVVLVVPADRVGDGFGADRVVAGGATRSASVRAGLAAAAADAEVIVVHDAARPLAGADLYRRVVAAVRDGVAAAVPGMPIGDTVKRVDDDGRVVDTLRRDGLVAVQTPQAFLATALREAHARGGEATDDAALVEAAGGVVVVVPGDRAAGKITARADLAVLERLLEERR